VAVIVFEDLTTGHETAHVATGLTEEILVALTKFTEFRVIGPLWPDRLTGGNGELEEILSRYGARFAVHGRVQSVGEVMEVSARLQDTASATSLWAETYALDAGSPELFELRREVTRRIAGTLADGAGVLTKTLVSESRGRSAEDLTAYEAVLRGYHWAAVLTDEAYREARRALEHAVTVAPGYAPARAILSDLYFSDYLSAIDPDEGSLDRAESLATEAVGLDPECHDARWTLGQVHFARGRRERFAHEFDSAIALNPYKASTLASYALFLAGLEEFERASELVERAKSLSPHHPAWFHMVLFMVRYRSGDLVDALAEATRIVMPGLMWGPAVRAATLGRMGRVDEARSEVAELLKRQPLFEANPNQFLGRLFRTRDGVEAILEGLYAAGLSRREGASEAASRVQLMG
jgi:TolB-like protein